MKKLGFLLVPGVTLILLTTGCETTQGMVTPERPATTVGADPGYTPPRDIEPAPESRSYPGQEAFQAAVYDPGVGPYPDAERIVMRVGEIREVFRGSATIGGDRELAFFIPEEARSVVQLVVEARGLTRTYFLRAVGRGDTVGGVVERRWLDHQGYDPRDAAALARIQSSVRANPVFISVQ